MASGLESLRDYTVGARDVRGARLLD